MIFLAIDRRPTPIRNTDVCSIISDLNIALWFNDSSLCVDNKKVADNFVIQ